MTRHLFCHVLVTVNFIAIEKPSGSEEEEQEQEEPTAEQEMADAATRPRFVDWFGSEGVENSRDPSKIPRFQTNPNGPLVALWFVLIFWSEDFIAMELIEVVVGLPFGAKTRMGKTINSIQLPRIGKNAPAT